MTVLNLESLKHLLWITRYFESSFHFQFILLTKKIVVMNGTRTPANRKIVFIV